MNIADKQLSPALVAALALTAKHIEPVEPIIVPEDPLLAPKVRANVVHKNLSKKTIHNRKRNKLAAKSRRRNRR